MLFKNLKEITIYLDQYGTEYQVKIFEDDTEKSLFGIFILIYRKVVALMVCFAILRSRNTEFGMQNHRITKSSTLKVMNFASEFFGFAFYIMCRKYVSYAWIKGNTSKP